MQHCNSGLWWADTTGGGTGRVVLVLLYSPVTATSLPHIQIYLLRFAGLWKIELEWLCRAELLFRDIWPGL